MFKRIRNSKISKGLAVYFSLSLIFQIISPTVAMALTSGPGQEEFASFEPASTSDMVDLYSGDYNYNIPLLSVPGPNGGYPINLAYHSGIGMEQEASWVGLGWNLNVGSISRNLRGLPDDFGGDAVTKTQHIKKNVTTSVDVPMGAHTEFIGFPTGGGGASGNSLQLYYNNYKGMGMRYTYSATKSTGGGNLGLAISNDSQNGMGIGLSFGPPTEFSQATFSGGFGLGANYNSRQGLQSFNFSHTMKMPVLKGQSSVNLPSSTLSFATVFGVPHTSMQTKSTTVPFTLRFAGASALFNFRSAVPISGSVYTSKVEKNGKDIVNAYGYINTISSPSALKDFSRDDIMYSKKIPHLATSSFTYDLYTQTGQGTGSMFRPHLNTFGVLSDPKKTSKDRVMGGGFETGVGAEMTLNMHVGLDFQFGAGQTTSGPWTQIGSHSDYGPQLQKLINWQADNAQIDYESYYFQVIGEKTGTYLADDQLIEFKGDAAVRLEMQKEREDNSFLRRHFKASDYLISHESETSAFGLDGSNQTKQQNDDKRQKRSTSIQTLTTAESQLYGYSKNLQYRDVPASPCTVPDPYEETGSLVSKDFSKPHHHVSEISMLQADGMRYVYGLPAYNNKQIDNVFAIDQDAGSDANFSDAIVHDGTTGGINVSATYDEYVSKNEMPKYAHSWMLTTVLSADYLDMTNNGPTDDDFGYWVKFNYKKVATDYKWRVPYTKANYLDGYKNNPQDNKGSYTYGEKDVYVLESVETKTHIAVFETSCRKDGFEAFGEKSNGYSTENNGRGTKTLHKLDKIKLYTKREYTQTTPVPTKVINFEYSYDLCGNVPNNNTDAVDVNGNNPLSSLLPNVNARLGKLTLTKLYFTYQNSNRGKLSPYVFNYGDVNDAQDNPDYNKLNMDRWGNSKTNNVYGGTTYPYIDRPYTDQGPYTGASSEEPAPWTLKEISLPTGGTLKMEYESDDYAYVEDKQATRMYDIAFLDKNSGSPETLEALLDRSRGVSGSTELPTEDLTSGGGLNRVYFKLEKPLRVTMLEMGISTSGFTQDDYDAWFRKLYLDNLTGGYVYFNNYAFLKEKIGGGPEVFDYVKGYAELDLSDPTCYGVTSLEPDGDPAIMTGYVPLLPIETTDFGYFVVKNKPLSSPLNTTGMSVSPFTLAAIQHLRAYRQELIYTAIPYGATGSPLGQIVNLFATLPGSMADLMASVIGFNNYAYQKDWGKQIQVNGRSIVKLCSPQYKKIGGGVRVKKITLNDNWRNDASTPAASLYGQKYEYTKTATIGGKEAIISSGVAYEPQVGKEESALRSPINYTNSIPLHGHYSLFMENPIMDDYYPGASVGYSKVTVTSIASDQALADNGSNPLAFSSVPISIHEFYTPKDFPLIFSKTDMNPGQPIRIPIMIPGILTSFTTRQAKSQGYSIITNDMAGKPKAVTTQTKNGGQIISRQKFIYNTEEDYNEDAVNRLSSKVQTLEIDKADNYEVKYRTSIVGQTHDMFIDMNEDAQEMESFGLETNLDMQFSYPPPAFIFMIMPIPTVKVDRSSMRTVVFNKIINRTGILKRVETTTNESTIITDNLAYDIETGEPLLTKVTNEFKDPVYNFSYPGHWYYPNLEGAYKNDGLVIDPAGGTSFTSDSDGYIDISSALGSTRPVSDYFAKGDLLYVDCTDNFYDGQYQVYNINESNYSLLLMNSLGHLFPESVNIVQSIKVIKSGFKNMQSSKVGSIVFKEMNPTFKQYLPSDHLGTAANTVTDVFYSDLTSNKIVNASAIEFSNDWQVFCGDLVEPETTCVCDLTTSAYSFLSMLQDLNYNNLLFSEDVELYDMETDFYSNGFSSTLLNTSANLLSVKGAEETGTPPNKFYYQGYVDGGDDLEVLIYHNPSDNVIENDYDLADCRVTIHLPSGTTWDEVASLSSISKADPLTEGETDCITPGEIFMQVVKEDGEIVTATVVIGPCTYRVALCKCWVFEDCYEVITPNYACGITDGQPINPYLAGMKGMWRPQASYAYNTMRTQANDLKEDGIYTDFVRFPWEDPTTKDPKWIKATTVTKYSPYGFELENKDALGNYSSALYGYSQALVTAIGSNAMYKELAFDNFEDYPLACNDRHFRFEDFEANITQNYAHTGKYSISVDPSSSINAEVAPVADACTFVPIDNTTNPTTRISHSPYEVAHLVDDCDCLGKFSPLPNKKYVASVWTKQVNHSGPILPGVTNYTAPQLKITIALSAGGPTVLTFIPKGNVIDEWQQIFESFTIPSNATGITVELVNSEADKNVYFDDIRLHPFDANMVSYVYDPILLKTMAELDANNFATIYVYDDEGHLNKVKKETSEGIKTIKEGRINTKKLNE